MAGTDVLAMTWECDACKVAPHVQRPYSASVRFSVRRGHRTGRLVLTMNVEDEKLIRDHVMLHVEQVKQAWVSARNAGLSLGLGDIVNAVTDVPIPAALDPRRLNREPLEDPFDDLEDDEEDPPVERMTVSERLERDGGRH